MDPKLMSTIIWSLAIFQSFESPLYDGVMRTLKDWHPSCFDAECLRRLFQVGSQLWLMYQSLRCMVMLLIGFFRATAEDADDDLHASMASDTITAPPCVHGKHALHLHLVVWSGPTACIIFVFESVCCLWSQPVDSAELYD